MIFSANNSRSISQGVWLKVHLAEWLLNISMNEALRAWISLHLCTRCDLLMDFLFPPLPEIIVIFHSFQPTMAIMFSGWAFCDAHLTCDSAKWKKNLHSQRTNASFFVVAKLEILSAKRLAVRLGIVREPCSHHQSFIINFESHNTRWVNNQQKSLPSATHFDITPTTPPNDFQFYTRNKRAISSQLYHPTFNLPERRVIMSELQKPPKVRFTRQRRARSLTSSSKRWSEQLKSY